ncbi:hypothetical protein BGW39_011325 [Mortierella sp. 14UC]|nr:hypothetical protein BGW39_011325 [Mortierella sp. 14UC]
MNAGLHFSRINLDLTPLTQVPQYSVHVAAGDHQTGGSVILNTWAPQDQNLGEINSNLQLLRQEDQEATGNEPPIPDTWLEQALREAIAHILEPPQDPSGSAWRLISAKNGYDEGRINTSVATVVNAATSTATTTTQPRSTYKIVFVLADPETSFRKIKRDDGDTDMEDDEDEDSWFYGSQDIRGMLYEAVRSMEVSIKKRNVNLHVDFIRIVTSQSQARGDIIMEQISRTCTASVYTVISQDELSPMRALTNYFLLQNTDVKVLRVHDPVFTEKFRKDSAVLFHRSDHIVPKTVRKTDVEGEQDSNMSILQQPPLSMQNAIDTDHAQEHRIHRSIVYFLTDRGSTDNIATRAIVNHAGRIFVHCIPTEFESGMPKRIKELIPGPVKGGMVPSDDRSRREDFVMTKDSAATSTSVSDIMKRPLLGKTVTPVVQDFIDAIIQPNLVQPKKEWGGGGFVELTPPALKTTAAVQFKAKGGGGGVKSHARKDQATVGVDMAVVHSTKRLDLETRWLVQWQGERVHPIVPEHRVLLEQFRSVICNTVVASIEPITTILEKLITDARPAVLPGVVAIPENLPPTQIKIIQQAVQTTQQLQQHQNPAVRESAQAILADLWMVGQRFKSLSPSHAAVAKEIGEMVAPTGLDYNTVKLTYIAPVLRVFQQAKEIDPTLVANLPDGASPNLNQGQGQGMMGNNTWGGRGGGNVGGGIRGGRGGMQGGARFGDSNNNRNNANNRRGGFGGPGGGGGGIPGGLRNSGGGGGMGSGVNANTVSSNTEEILMDPSLPLVSMSGRTQPVPYLETSPPTREEIDNGDQAYLSELGEEGSLLRTYWGPRGAQGSSVAAIVNSMNSLDSTTLLEPSVPGSAVATAAGPIPGSIVLAPPSMGTGQDLASIHAAQRRLKRPRLQDFAGRTPVKEYGGFSKA